MVISSANPPIITLESVQEALDRLVFTTVARGCSPLASLSLVNAYLEDSSMAVSADAASLRDVAVQDILTDIITAELARQRAVLGLPLPDLDTPFEDEVRLIKQDSASTTSRLLAWSNLYYRYVRVDLGLSPDDYAQYAGRDTRSLRRNRQHALRLLTHRLIKLEQAERLRRRQVRLREALPPDAKGQLVGREDAFAKVFSALEREHPVCLLISGGSGYGKTSFVSAVIRQQIKHDLKLDAVAWINSPTSKTAVLNQVCELLALDIRQNSPKAQFGLRKTVIVLDDVTGMAASELDELLVELAGASVYMTTAAFIPLRHPVEHVPMRDLTEQEIAEYLRLAGGIDENMIDATAAHVKSQTGGHPYAVKLAYDQYVLEMHQTSARDVLLSLFDRKFRQFDRQAQLLWAVLAIGPDAGLQVDTVKHLWPMVADDGTFALLADHHLVRITASGSAVLVSSAQRYIRAAYDQREEFRVEIDALVTDLADLFEQSPVLGLPLVEHILYTDWPGVSLETVKVWFRAILDHYTVLPHRAFAILEKLYEKNADLTLRSRIVYGRELRRRGKWEEAGKVLSAAITRAGQSGEFLDQAEAFLELGVLLAYSGQFERAYQLFDNAERLAKRFGDVGLTHHLAIERAQIAIDTRNPREAHALLKNLPQSGRVLALFAETCLLLGDLGVGLAAANDAQRHFYRDTLNICRMQILMGRLHLANGEYALAEGYLQAAVTALEAQNDLFALGRAWSNLGAAFIHLKKYRRAEIALEKALSIQKALNDRVGLLVTQQNIELLAK